MNKLMKICTINDITSIDFNLVDSHQIENYGIGFEHDAEKFHSKNFSFSSQSAKW